MLIPSFLFFGSHIFIHILVFISLFCFRKSLIPIAGPHHVFLPFSMQFYKYSSKLFYPPSPRNCQNVVTSNTISVICFQHSHVSGSILFSFFCLSFIHISIFISVFFVVVESNIILFHPVFLVDKSHFP